MVARIELQFTIHEIILMLQKTQMGRRPTRAASAIAILLALVTPAAFRAQTPSTKQAEPRPGMGVSTGAARTYASRRTVGVPDPNAPVIFEDMTARTALASFKHRSGDRGNDYILEAASGGAAVLDYDNDGLPDIYLLNGSTIGAARGKAPPPRAALY